MITGNKGEWSEIYTLFKLLGDKQLSLGNDDIEKLEDVVYPIIRILRSESTKNFEYSIHDDLVLISGNKEEIKIPISVFKEKALLLLQKIKENKSRTFSVPAIEEFMYSINCMSLKADSIEKTDIRIVIHDQRTNQQPTLGFSIKSQLGNPSTLLNAGKTTNFVYQIEGLELDNEEIVRINNISSKSKIKDRILELIRLGAKFKFKGTEKQIFSNNLILIDSLLPQILSRVLFKFFSTNLTTLSDIVKEVELENPLHFDISNEHKFYEYKFKRLLTDVALGMMPSKVWTGKYDATGGYLVVKEDGEVLCYHIYNRNQFENYLLNNTKLETASSSRHGFGKIEKVENQLIFKLNLQIRFIK